MPSFVVRTFRGRSSRVQPRLLQVEQAQSAINTLARRGSLGALRDNLNIWTPTKAGTIRSIYRFGQDASAENQYWFHWTADVSVARGPIAADTSERTYYTGDGVPKVTDATLALTGGGTDYPINSYTLGVPAPTVAPTLNVSGTATPGTTPESRAYVYTYVSGWGEEGPPSPAAITSASPGQSVDMSSMQTGPAGAYNITAKRIYRSVVGSDGSTEYLFVAEIGVAATTYSDTTATSALGSAMVSAAYDPPPSTLDGLIACPNGIMAGFVGNDVYLCEPWRPHAWPAEYVATANYKVVALGAFDTTIVVLTNGFPYLLQGTHPSLMAMVKSDLQQACVSKRSIVSADGGVFFAGPDGLWMISAQGARNLTAETFTREQWQAFKPSSISGYWWEGTYVGFYDTGSATGGFLLTPGGEWFDLDFYATAGYMDPLRDALYLVVSGQIVRMDGAGTYRARTWMSKDFYTPQACAMGYARVEAETYPVTLRYDCNGVTVGSVALASAEVVALPDAANAGRDHRFVLTTTAGGEILSAGIGTGPEELLGG